MGDNNGLVIAFRLWDGSSIEAGWLRYPERRYGPETITQSTIATFMTEESSCSEEWSERRT